MFLLTVNKDGLRKAGAAVLCLGCLAATVAGVGLLSSRTVEAAATVTQVPVTSTQDIASYFSDKGLPVDLTTATVDTVKVPRRWDDSFSAFSAVVAQSGLDLGSVRGKQVEKWMVLCPGRSGGNEKVYAVLLVYKQKAVGAYLLGQPSGEVTGLSDAAETAAPLTETEAAQAAALFGSGEAPEADWPSE